MLHVTFYFSEPLSLSLSLVSLSVTNESHSFSLRMKEAIVYNMFPPETFVMQGLDMSNKINLRPNRNTVDSLANQLLGVNSLKSCVPF
jgi:hypothetical protein